MRRHVDGDAQRQGVRVARAPARCLLADLAKNVLPKRDDETVVLGQRDEFVRCDPSPFRMTPTGERFQPEDATRGQREDRLVVDFELVRVKRRGESFGERHLA